MTRPAVPDDADSFSDLTLAQLLDEISARTPAPASGSAAGVAVALGAALCAMAARFSGRSLDGAEAMAETAERLRARVLHLAQEDARAYAAVMAARRLPAEASRQEALAAAMARAVAIPLEIAEIGGEIGRMATLVASEGNTNLLGDALSAVLIAEAGASAAATIAEINLAESRAEGDSDGCRRG
ncbi:MAG TPA: cyclodeaminase/cyclohydrolase family protein [Acidimicrobiales bacterium]|nr:cyclodeaminase/cyclohydrolase family protein [Acidimicrobiales bacterium]